MSSNDSIRPFQIDIPEESLQELRRRVAVPRWPDKETVSDRTQGAQLAKVQKFVDYWATDYNWRKLEAKLNSFPQFITELDGLDIHFIHVRSPHANALPLIMTHGWPGSFLEYVEGDRATERSRVTWSPRGGRVRSRGALNARLRVLSQTAGDRLEPRTHRRRLG